jgi:hypothetical protein
MSGIRQATLNILRMFWRVLSGAATHARSVLDRSPARPPAWEADLLDDLAFNRPWNIVIKALRLRARLTSRRLQQGQTIVIANWNTLSVLQDTLYAVRALTPANVELMIVDNGSTDGSREWLRSQKGLRVIALPANAGHAVALDIATLLCKTDVVVTLDSDAVPLREGWLDAVIEPLRREKVILVGLRSSRNFVHPVFSALHLRQFIRRKLSFQVWQLPDITEEDRIWGQNCWDTAELMTARLQQNEVVFVDQTPNPVPGLPGMTAGDVVYHHGGVTRATEETAHDLSDRSYHNWRSALEELLPPEALR